MSRKFKTPDYESTLNQTIRLSDALPPNHLARFVVDVIAQLDLNAIYQRYAPVGGEALAPEILLGLLFYGYATGLFSSRKLERATYDSIPFRFVAGGLHPDHDTIAHFRKTDSGKKCVNYLPSVSALIKGNSRYPMTWSFPMKSPCVRNDS